MNLDPSEGIAVFTDGSANHLDRNGGWAWVALDAFEGMETDSGFQEQTTNNQMELCAPAKALLTLHEEFGPIDVLVCSDSQYMILGITQRTRKRNKNRRWWDTLDVAVDAHRIVRFEHVKGHSGHQYNDMADELAGLARQKC